jgi:murein DD-endopeptidase MepM/ murein hydrolase activator NlpD
MKHGRSAFGFSLILLALTGSCGPGSDPLSHTGVCGAYPTYTTSSYKLPYATGTSREVGQGNCSGISHFGDYRYAYDFTMDIGTAVHAARAGTVIELQESYSDGNGCPNANFVKIRHSDGTVGEYLHLTKNGVIVNVNDTIAQGQHIGNSGNTGCSTAGHLHFQVVESSTSNESVPVTFSNTSSNPRGLQSGSSYTAN